MSLLLAVDPGINGCGIALFGRALRDLYSACYVKNDADPRSDTIARAEAMADAVYLSAGGPYTHALVVEFPQVYPQSKGDPNDLLMLAAVGGALAAKFSRCSVQSVKPRAWKGQQPPNVCARNVLAELSPIERERVQDLPEFLEALARCEKSKREIGHKAHNTVDAIGIGLHYLDRF